MDHERYKEMLALDALGALDGADAEALRAHLESCAECRAERDGWLGVAASLAHTAKPVTPPAELRARVLEQIGRTRQVSADERQAGAPNQVVGAASRLTTDSRDGGSGESIASAPTATNVLPFEAERRRGALILSKPAFWTGAVAASLLVAALAATLAVLWRRNQELSAELARASARAEQLAARAEESQRELARVRDAGEMFADPDARMTTLAGTKMAPGASARLAFDHSTGRTLLVATGLPPAPPGKAYQLWFIKGAGAPVPGRVFKADAGGASVLRDQAPPEGLGADTFAVTLEPEAGVASATGEIYLLGKSS